MTNGRKGKLVASCSLEWNSSMVSVEFCRRHAPRIGTLCPRGLGRAGRLRAGQVPRCPPWPAPRLTTSPSTSVRTRSPISGEMSLPNCCRVVRKRLSLLSCRAPQAGGRSCVDSEAVDEVAGPLLKPLGVQGVPWTAVGE